MKVSDLVIKFLEEQNLDFVFTVSGGGCIHLIDSLGKSSKLQYICTHHEQSAAMAAEGYARIKDGVGACILTTGPGGTNALTGVLGSWLDSIPIIVISGQVNLSQTSSGTNCRQVGDQEFNIVETAKSMTKYSVMIKDKNEILYELEKAFHIATSGRPGPVWIDIPLDIQGSTVDYNTLMKYEDTSNISPLNIKDIESIKKAIENSKKPLIMVGNGIRLSKTTKKLDVFLKKFNLPVLTSIHSAIDAVDNNYDFYCGRIGILGQLTSNKIIQECDLLIVLGSRLTVKMTGYNLDNFSPLSKKIIVDIDVNEINKHSFKIDKKIVCDLNSFFDAMNSLKLNLNIYEWQQRVRNLRQDQIYVQKKHIEMKGYLSLYYFISKAHNYFKSIPIITSNGSAHVVTLQTYKINNNQRIFTNVGCASMGYGLPAAIGACFGINSKPVICFEGDGSLMMNLQDIQTMITHKLPIKLFIINNDGYLSIKLTQESFFKGFEVASGKESGVEIPSYKKLSKAFGVKYFSIEDNSQIDKKLKQIMAFEGPCIIELFTHPKERHEPKVVSKGIDSNGKIIPGDLTDMYISEGF